jgi:hypothetical protein
MFSKWHLFSFTGSLLVSGLTVLTSSAAADEIDRTPASEPLPGTFDSLITDVNRPALEIEQVTSVSQLSDVEPTDWAYQALQSLVERYGCIAGYPNSTFRGSRAATRYELAAALNACLDQISDRFATKEDLEAVKALQEEFKTELATLKGRVDGLEAQAATLEAQQFSTTTKLKGEAVFLASYLVSDQVDVAAGTPTVDDDNRMTFSDRIRLNFDTSFTGKDLLRVRLQARNIVPLDATTTGTNMTRLAIDGNENNAVLLEDLYYKFPIGKKAKMTVIANAGKFNDAVGDTFNPYLENNATGALSRFGRFNPIYRFAEGGAGAIFNYEFTDQLAVSVGYMADRPANAIGPTGGLFGGSYSALAQLEVQPTKSFGFGVAYVHSFQEDGLVSVTGATGSSFARRPFGNFATNADSVGLQLNWQVSPRFNVSGWAGYTRASDERSDRKADIINWAAVFAFPDLFQKGNLGAIVVGQQPRVFNTINFDSTSDPNANFHVEALYRINVNDYISITPGVIMIINPENNSQNGPDFVPIVRTTFKF